ncbi:MAG: hypothetical protein E7378_04555 [Clostridiales bacterium]|nr:hypothetical protein [Clostridiales bacterium]
MKKFLYALCAVLIGFVGIVFGGCTAPPEKYNIYVRINHARYGTVSGGNGVFEEGQEITIKAIPTESDIESQNSTFLCWILNNKVVSNQKEYTFEVSSETAGTYVALFESEKSEYVAIDNIQIRNGIDNFENTNLVKIELKLGTIETVLTTVYLLEIDDENVETLDNSTIYEEDKLPFTYDMQQKIYGQVVLTYEQDDAVFTSITNFNIAENNDINEVKTCLKNNNVPPQEDPDAEPTIPYFDLNKPINDQTADKMNIVPGIVINFARITAFDFEFEEDAEQTPAQ